MQNSGMRTDNGGGVEGKDIRHGKISGERTGSGSAGFTLHYHDIMEATRNK